MKIVILCIVTTLIGLSAQAQQDPVMNVGTSTLGATIEVGYRLGPNFGLRDIGGRGQANFNSNFNGAPIKGTSYIGATGLLADVFFAGGVRISQIDLDSDLSAINAELGQITILPFVKLSVSFAF